MRPPPLLKRPRAREEAVSGVAMDTRGPTRALDDGRQQPWLTRHADHGQRDDAAPARPEGVFGYGDGGGSSVQEHPAPSQTGSFASQSSFSTETLGSPVRFAGPEAYGMSPELLGQSQALQEFRSRSRPLGWGMPLESYHGQSMRARSDADALVTFGQWLHRV